MIRRPFQPVLGALLFLCGLAGPLAAQTPLDPVPMDFDDMAFLNGYIARYEQDSQETILAMISDDTLDPFKLAAAVHVFREQYSWQVVSREKILAERLLIRRLSRADSPFVEVEVMNTLCRMDRYKYFHIMIPPLIQKLDHYNIRVSQLAHKALTDLVNDSSRPREAGIVFNALRKVLFLTRKRLAQVTTPDERLTQKLTLLRWSIKILGAQELRKLPKEVMNLL